jgi:hypothetical protein
MYYCQLICIHKIVLFSVNADFKYFVIRDLVALEKYPGTMVRWIGQGKLTEVEGSIQLTSLHQPVFTTLHC